MTNQDSKPTLNIDFSHRLAITDHLSDSVDLIAERAISVLSILSMQFHESKTNPIPQADHITAAAMDSVLCDLEDIKSLTNAHYERNKIIKKQEMENATSALSMVDERLIYSFLDALQMNIPLYFEKPKRILYGDRKQISETLFLMWQNHKKCGAADTLSDYDDVIAVEKN